MTRYRLLDPPHKGIRNLLGRWSLASGSTDVRTPAELHELQSLTAMVVALLEDHAANEADWIFPLLEARAPGSTAQLLHEHEELDAELLAARDQVMALASTSTVDEVLDAHLAVTAFQAHYLLHLVEEERDFEPRLWALYSDAELRGAEASVAASLDPSLLLSWFAVCAPARTVAENVDVLSNVRAVLPPEAFGAVLETLHRELPPARLEAILSALDEA